MSIHGDCRPIPIVKIRFKVMIGDNNMKESSISTIYGYYLSPWNNFLRELSKLVNDKVGRKEYLELPDLRLCVPSSVTLASLMPLFYRKNRELHKLLMDVGPMFDLAPHDFKVHIIGCVGVTSLEFKEYALNTIPEFCG